MDEESAARRALLLREVEKRVSLQQQAQEHRRYRLRLQMEGYVQQLEKEEAGERNAIAVETSNSLGKMREFVTQFFINFRQIDAKIVEISSTEEPQARSLIETTEASNLEFVKQQYARSRKDAEVRERSRVVEELQDPHSTSQRASPIWMPSAEDEYEKYMQASTMQESFLQASTLQRSTLQASVRRPSTLQQSFGAQSAIPVVSSQSTVIPQEFSQLSLPNFVRNSAEHCSLNRVCCSSSCGRAASAFQSSSGDHFQRTLQIRNTPLPTPPHRQSKQVKLNENPLSLRLVTFHNLLLDRCR